VRISFLIFPDIVVFCTTGSPGFCPVEFVPESLAGPDVRWATCEEDGDPQNLRYLFRRGPKLQGPPQMHAKTRLAVIGNGKGDGQKLLELCRKRTIFHGLFGKLSIDLPKTGFMPLDY
jgi:hypothetical protein